MKTKKVFLAMGAAAIMSSCSVQQFSVNSEVEPFDNGGKVFGEKTKNLEIEKSGDLYILGINVIKSDETEDMAEDLKAESYTVETKSNLLLNVLTGGFVTYRTVKVIKRDK